MSVEGNVQKTLPSPFNPQTSMSLNCSLIQCRLWNEFDLSNFWPNSIIWRSCEQRSHSHFECFVVKYIDERICAADHERHDLRSIEGESKVIEWNVSDGLCEQ